MKNKKKTIGYGFVGRWRDGTLGWFLPTHCSGYRRYPDSPNDNENLKGETTYLCRITIEQVFKKMDIKLRGR